MRLAEEIERLIHAGTTMIHLDVMDNHYVPNLTFGPLIAEHLHQEFPRLEIDVHLMASPVDDLIRAFSKAGAHRISIHPEATPHLDKSLSLIKSLGCHAGLALNPATSLDCLTWSHHHLDLVLVMTVNPGFGGQSLLPNVIQKIQAIHKFYPQLTLCVDGGIKSDNIHTLHQAGAQEFIVGSALFNTPCYTTTLNELHKNLDKP